MNKKTARRWMARNAWTLAKCRSNRKMTTKVKKQLRWIAAAR